MHDAGRHRQTRWDDRIAGSAGSLLCGLGARAIDNDVVSFLKQATGVSYGVTDWPVTP